MIIVDKTNSFVKISGKDNNLLKSELSMILMSMVRFGELSSKDWLEVIDNAIEYAIEIAAESEK